MPATHELSDLIGKPFAWGGRGPDAYDCYGLVKELLRRDGVVVPDFRSPKEGARIIALFTAGVQEWRPAAIEQGATCLIRLPGIGKDMVGTMHCGYMLNDHQMIHTWEKSGGVTIERIEHWKHRILGFYRYVGKPTI